MVKEDADGMAHSSSSDSGPLQLQRTCHFSDTQIRDLKLGGTASEVYLVVTERGAKIGRTGGCAVTDIAMTNANTIGSVVSDVFIGTSDSGLFKGSITSRSASDFGFERFHFTMPHFAISVDNDQLFIGTSRGLVIRKLGTNQRSLRPSLGGSLIDEPVYSSVAGRGNAYFATDFAVKYFSMREFNQNADDPGIVGVAIPVDIGTIQIGERGNSIAVAGDRLFVATEGGLKVIGLDDASPRVGTTVPDTASAASVAIVGREAYVGTASGLKVVDIGSDNVISTMLSGVNVRRVWADLNARLLLVGSQSSGGSDLRIYSIDPSVVATESAQPGLSITNTSLPDAIVGRPYSVQLSAMGGIAPYSWQLSGAHPAGLGLGSVTGVITGTPSSRAPATFTNISVTVTDNLGTQFQKIFSMRVQPTPVPNAIQLSPSVVSLSSIGQSSGTLHEMQCLADPAHPDIVMGFKGESDSRGLSALQLACGHLSPGGIDAHTRDTESTNGDSLTWRGTCGMSNGSIMNVPIGFAVHMGRSRVNSTENGNLPAIDTFSLICAPLRIQADGTEADPVIDHAQQYSAGSYGNTNATADVLRLCGPGSVMTGFDVNAYDDDILGISSANCSPLMRDGVVVNH